MAWRLLSIGTSETTATSKFDPVILRDWHLKEGLTNAIRPLLTWFNFNPRKFLNLNGATVEV